MISASGTASVTIESSGSAWFLHQTSFNVLLLESCGPYVVCVSDSSAVQYGSGCYVFLTHSTVSY